jgi:cytochrome c
MFTNNSLIGAGIALMLASGAANASDGDNHDPQVSDQMSQSGFVLENGLAIPAFDAKKGRLLFGSKGCVVCHSVNGIGGEDAPEFSAEIMEHPMNAFEFAAGMWRGAPAMIMMQEEELGEQIELNGEELAAIIAFVHDEEEQKLFSKDDIPEEILEIMEGDHE